LGQKELGICEKQEAGKDEALTTAEIAVVRATESVRQPV
jgi:hypothetical protein